MSTRVFIIDNPDNPHDVPILEGTLSEISARLVAGDYNGHDFATGAPVVVTVGASDQPATVRLAD